MTAPLVEGSIPGLEYPIWHPLPQRIKSKGSHTRYGIRCLNESLPQRIKSKGSHIDLVVGRPLEVLRCSLKRER
jgi:hypothetical protein